MTFALEAGGDRATIDPAEGGRLVSLVLGGHERLITERQPRFSPPLDPGLSYGVPLMAPFVGRLSGAAFAWDGRECRVPRNYGEIAIHGTVYDAPWDVVARTSTAIDLRLHLDRARWPFGATMTQRYEISAGRLEVEAAIVAEEPQPAAIGWHPWFRRSGAMTIRVASEQTLELDDSTIPTGALVPVNGPRDLRGGPEVGDRALDDVFTDVASPAVLTWPDLELALAFEAPVRMVVVFTQPESICVEPMTAWPDAIRLSRAGKRTTGLVGLAAGERLVAKTTWSWRQPAR